MKHSLSLFAVLLLLTSPFILARPNRRTANNPENTRWVKSPAVAEQNEAVTQNAAPEATRDKQPEVQKAPEVKPDMLLSLRNLLNFLAANHIKTGLPTTPDSVTSPCAGYTADGSCIMVATESQAGKWNVSNRSKAGSINPTDVQKGSNVSPDGSKKSIINSEERLIIVDTKTGEQIIGPSLAGYQIMLGKPKLSWSHISPVWCPNGNQCAIAADGLIVLVDIPHLIEVDSFIKQATPQQLAVLEKIHNSYRTFDQTGKAQLTKDEKSIYNEFPGVVTKALKPYVQ